jgi:hypothetical protein
VFEGAVDPQLDRLAGEVLELLVGPEQVDLDPGDHLGDRQVGNRGEGLLAELEEVEVGGVSEVEELEVVLPDPLGEILERWYSVLEPSRCPGPGPR